MPHDPEPVGRKRIGNNRAFALLAAGETVVWTCLFYVFPALLIRWESAYSWSKVQLTGAITLALFLSAVMSPFFGKLIDRGNGPWLLAIGAFFGGCALYLASCATQLWQFYLLWGVIGCCFAACLYEPCFAILTRAYGKDARRGIIIVTLTAGFASTISFPAAHWIANYWDWQIVMRCFALATLFAGVPLLYFGAVYAERDYMRFASGRGAAADKNYSLSAAIRNSTFLRLAIAFALLAVVHGATLHHLLYILGDRGLAIGMSVFVASLIGPMQVFGRVVITVLQKQLSHKLIVYGAFTFMGSAMVLLFNVHYGLYVAIIFAVVFGSGYGTLSVIRPLVARDLLGEENFGAKSGLLALFYLIGAAASPYAGSLVWVAGGYDALIASLMVLAFGGLWLVFRAMRDSIRTPYSS